MTADFAANFAASLEDTDYPDYSTHSGSVDCTADSVSDSAEMLKVELLTSLDCSSTNLSPIQKQGADVDLARSGGYFGAFKYRRLIVLRMLKCGC